MNKNSLREKFKKKKIDNTIVDNKKKRKIYINKAKQIEKRLTDSFKMSPCVPYDLYGEESWKHAEKVCDVA